MEGKVCTKCGELKQFNDFYKSNRIKCGYQNPCKNCQKEYRKKKPTAIRTDIGKSCTKCNVFKPFSEFAKNNQSFDGYRPCCKACNNARNKEYAKKNKEKIKNKKHNYYLENKETITNRTKEYYQENKEYYKDYQIKYREENYDILYNLTVKRRSYDFHVEFTPLQRKKIIERDNYTCQYCGIKVHDRRNGNWNTFDKAHIDHIIPISKGGNSEPNNLQVLCRTCNLSKSNKVIV